MTKQELLARAQDYARKLPAAPTKVCIVDAVLVNLYTERENLLATLQNHIPAGVAAFIKTIDSTGGIVRFNNGIHAPAADLDWVDLGEAYLATCQAYGIDPLVRRATREENMT